MSKTIVGIKSCLYGGRQRVKLRQGTGALAYAEVAVLFCLLSSYAEGQNGCSQ